VLTERTRCQGFLLVELITGIFLLGVIIAGLGVLLDGFSSFNEYQWARQRCTAAAQAQLESLTATKQPVESQTLKRLWPNVDVSVDRSPGVTPWQGLELIRVTAIAQAGPRKVTIRLARYVCPQSAVAKGGRP